MHISSRSVNQYAWPPYEQFLFLVGWFLRAFSETVCLNKAKFYRKYPWKVFYKISSYHSVWTKTWLPWSILISDCLKLKKKHFSSGTRTHNKLILCRNDIWEIIYKISIFRSDCTTNMTRIDRSCLWLANGQLKKIFSKTIWPNWLKFGRKHLWKVLYKVSSKQNDRWATMA